MMLEALNQRSWDVIWKWRNDRRIWAWCRQNTLISDMQQQRWIEAQDLDPTIKMFAIRPGGGGLVGVCGLTDIDHINQRAEFSLYIGPEYQRKGYAKRALSELLSHGFFDLNLNVIWGETFDQNPAIRLFESLGMVKDGTRRDHYFKGGKFIDCHLYSLRRSEWNPSDGLLLGSVSSQSTAG